MKLFGYEDTFCDDNETGLELTALLLVEKVLLYNDGSLAVFTVIIGMIEDTINTATSSPPPPPPST